ncbi:MAG: hypothetical protein K8I29_17660 [Alphaproteobacteria bacterium]|uniref:Cytochrome c-552/DMSO reductase-like haem-binding domain-containing protein n=1 Tax=Candidatus Nitrobium versatile TaxID=2884831 RepID=A0A953M319_9BACT|nr:hypothetical protein [Candidatus Nitrobium versatile]
MILKKLICLWMFLFLVAGIASAEDKKKIFAEFTSYRKNVDAGKVGLNDEVWKSLSPSRLTLQRQFLVVPKPMDVGVKEMLVQSFNDGKYIVFRLTWKDSTKNDGPKIMNFSDGAALQFPVKKDPLPEYFMGEQKRPVHILHWKAWRSKDKQAGFQDVKSAYPNMTVDMYNFDYGIKGAGTEKTQAEKDIFTPGKAAGNPLSFDKKEIVEELTSEGAGTLKSKNIENTSGDAEWKDGQWTVLFRRPLVVTDPLSVKFTAGEKMPVAFSIWEGERRESAGRKAVSPAWAEVKVE